VKQKIMEQSDSGLEFETKLLLYCVDSNYRRIIHGFPIEEINKIRWMRVLRKAAENRILYIYSKQMVALPEIPKTIFLRKTLGEIIKRGERWFDGFRRTMGFIDDILGKRDIPFLLMKTHKSVPYVASDVDILVKSKEEFNRIKDVLSQEGAILKEKEAGKALCKKTGLIDVGIHWSISWNGMTYIDSNLLWKETRRLSVYGVDCDVPSMEADLLICSAHIFAELYCITLGDFLHLSSLLQESLNWNIIWEQTKKHHWQGSFQRLLSIMSNIHNKVYSKPLFQINYPNSLSRCRVDFPYMYSFKDVLRPFWEKIRYEPLEKRPEEIMDFLRWLSFYAYRLLRRRMPRKLCFTDAFGGCNIPIPLEEELSV